MRKGEFDLTGKAIDCSGLPEMGDAGKEIFRALKLALGCGNDDEIIFGSIKGYRFIYTDGEGWFDMAVNIEDLDGRVETIQPIDVLGQATIGAAMRGGTIVFEGDMVPRELSIIYTVEGQRIKSTGKFLAPECVIAYKLLEEKQPSIESLILAEKFGTGQPLVEAAQPSTGWIKTTSSSTKHSHYFKDVSDLDEVDVYRVCDLFEVNDPSGAKQHAIKKLLCSGQRGAKDERKDLEEARDTIIRKLAMMTEDNE